MTTIYPHAAYVEPYINPADAPKRSQTAAGALDDAADKISAHVFSLRTQIDQTAPTYTPRVKDATDAITAAARADKPVSKAEERVLRDTVRALRRDLEAGLLPTDDVNPTVTQLLRDELRLTFDGIADPAEPALFHDEAGRASQSTVWRKTVADIVAEHGAGSDRAKVLSSSWFAAYARTRGTNLDATTRSVIAEYAETGSEGQKHAAAALRVVDSAGLDALAAHALEVGKMRAGSEGINSSHT